MISGNLFTRDYLLEGITRSQPWIALSGQEVASIKQALLKREHASSVEPTRQARADILALERKVSGLINNAYGLTPEERCLRRRA